MFQKGRQEQQIKYKSEVLKVFPYAYWYKIASVGGAIFSGGDENKRISEVYNVAWQAWESAYYKQNISDIK